MASDDPSAAGYDGISGFGGLYDAVPLYQQRPDVGFYIEEANDVTKSRPRAAVLEIGSGTGRVLLPLARAGYAVTGIEQSNEMLRRCLERVAAEPPEVRARVRLEHADARTFDIGGEFALAIAPFRVFQHFLTIDDQVNALASIRRHLAPHGRLVFDVFNPNYTLLTNDRSAETEDTPETQIEDGRWMRRTSRVIKVHAVQQVSDVELTYYLRAGGSTKRQVHSFQMRWYTPSELQHLLARTGFRLEHMYGNWDRSSLDEESPEIIVSAALAS